MANFKSITPVDQSAALPRIISVRTEGLNLFLTGFLVLFLELASIRWFAANVIFLQFFTNVVLLACFLGMSCGCMAARQRRDWLGYFPLLALGTVLAAVATLAIYNHWSGLAIDVGHQASPQEIFFGTEYRNPDVAQFTVPIDLIVAVFFVLIALMFVGLGQVLGRAFDAFPNRVMGYTLNIGGSLVGIAVFSLISLVQAPPAIWFFISCVGIAYLLRQVGGLTWFRGLTLVTLLVAVTLPDANRARHRHETFWSPYYAVDYDVAKLGIAVNNIGHQAMVPFDKGGSSYSLIHLLQRGAGGAPFQDELIIGAGSGNDIDHALRYGVGRIDAVEIDPVIQSIGIVRNPDQPYADPRVIRHLDDGRHFLRTTDGKYDLVVYALVDSLILHSGYANIRLESYLFTEQALADIKRTLKPGGIFVTYNYFRQGWVVERVAAMAESVFGCKPIVLSLPYRETLPSSSQAGFTMIVAGCNQQIADAFADHKNFWLNRPARQEQGRRRVHGAARNHAGGRTEGLAADRAHHDRSRDRKPALRDRRLAVSLSPRQADPRPQHPFDGRARGFGRGDGLSVPTQGPGAHAHRRAHVLPRSGLHAAGDKGGRPAGALVRQYVARQFAGVFHRPRF